MFSDPRWRTNLIVGVLLVTAGAVGLWAIGFWTPELIRHVLADKPKGYQDTIVSWATDVAGCGRVLWDDRVHGRHCADWATECVPGVVHWLLRGCDLASLAS